MRGGNNAAVVVQTLAVVGSLVPMLAAPRREKELVRLHESLGRHRGVAASLWRLWGLNTQARVGRSAARCPEEPATAAMS